MTSSMGWSKADLHVHTTYSSDALASVEEVLHHAATHTDLRILAITDHDTIDGALQARYVAKTYGIEVIVGEEISTAEGHLLALFIDEWVPPGRPAAESIAAVHAQGGLCIAAHPYGSMVPSMGWYGLIERIGDEWKLDGMECFNAGLWLPSNNIRATNVSAELRVAMCGGSDSHQCSTVGNGYTLFPGTTAEDLRAAIISQQTQAAGRPSGAAHLAEYAKLKLKGMLQSHAQRVFKPSV